MTAVEVVTADGEVQLCNKDQNSDLYWAARGAGPGFPAIVIAFYLEVRNRYTAARASTFHWPLSKYRAVLDWTIKVRTIQILAHTLLMLLQISPQCDDSIEAVCLAIRPDPSKEIVIMSHFVTFQNTEEDAVASLKIVNDTRPSGSIMESTNRVTSLEMEYDSQCAANPSGHRYMCDNAYINNDADVSEVLRDAFCTMPEGTKTFALWYAMNPCSRRQLPDMALSMQSDHYFALYTVWENQEDDDRCATWVKRIMAGVEKQSVGAYLGDSDFQIRRTKFWGDKEGERLMEIRRTWDPTGTICGYLDVDDKSGLQGLENVHEWQK